MRSRAAVLSAGKIVLPAELPYCLLCDAQTSGGLLIAVSEDKTAMLLDALAAGGVAHAAVIGSLTAEPEIVIS